MQPTNLNIKLDANSTVEVSLHEIESVSNKKFVVIGGHNYYLKVQGSSPSLALFHAKLERLSHREFTSLEEFKHHFQLDINNLSGTIEKTQEVATLLSSRAKEAEITKKRQEITEKILASPGSRQEIKALIAEYKQDLNFLRPIATALVQQGAIAKANQFVKLLPLFNDTDFDSCYLEVAKASYEYGKGALSNAVAVHGNLNEPVLALNYAYHLLSNIKYFTPRFTPPPSPEEVEKTIHDIQITLKQIDSKEALNTLECIEIRELLGSDAHVEVKDEKYLQTLLKEKPRFTQAFDKASKLQRRIDQDDFPPPPGKLIEIEVQGRPVSLHVQLSGNRKPGDPLVILEAGNGCFSSDWQKVQQMLPKDMLVMSYDRAGMGWSTASPLSPTIDNNLVILEKLLKTPGLEPPYIFVGHSYGGFVGQLFAMLHDNLEDIKGIILVDPAIEKPPPSEPPPTPTLSDYLPTSAKNGFFTNERVQYLDAEASFQVDRITAKTIHENTNLSEQALFTQSANFLKETLELKQKQNNKPIPCPMIVLTALKENMEGREIQNPEWRNQFLSQQDQLTGRAAVSEQKKIADSDHFINYFRPDAICKSILKMKT
jgi:pimeloyl-ACP methyl ester carboxylesterase